MIQFPLSSSPSLSSCLQAEENRTTEGGGGELTQPQWSGDCQDVAEAFCHKFPDRKDSQSVLSGREPCPGLPNSRSRVLKSRIFAGQKSSSVKTWPVRIWAVAEGIADRWLNEGVDNNVTSQIRDYLSLTRSPRFQNLLADSRCSCNAFIMHVVLPTPAMATISMSVSVSGLAAWMPVLAAFGAGKSCAEAHGKLKIGSRSHLF